MKILKARPWYAEANEQRLVPLCFFSIIIIAALNSILLLNVGLAFLYLLPLAIAAAFLSRFQVLVISLICALFAEGLSHVKEGVGQIPRGVFIFVTYAFVALLVSDMVVYRRAAAKRLQELEAELLQLHRAEQRWERLANSSPIGIITVSPEGTIVTCNRAAHDIFSVGVGALAGESIATFLPGNNKLHRPTPEPMQRAVIKANGNSFEAQVWTSQFSVDDVQMTTIIVVPQQT
jgi:PAS domain S-box-containing protein